MEISKKDEIYLETLQAAWLWSAVLEDVGIMVLALVFGLTPLAITIWVAKIIGFKLGKQYTLLLTIAKHTGRGSTSPKVKVLRRVLKSLDWISRTLLAIIIIQWALLQI